MYIGNISYSVYLVHNPVLNFLAKKYSGFDLFFVGLITTLILSSITYYVVEKPFINLGDFIIQRKRVKGLNIKDVVTQ